MSTVWYTSDVHLGHERAALSRGFARKDGSADIEAHDAEVIGSLRGCVRKQDTLYVLGDIATGGFDRALEQLRTIPGIKHLVSGNHDPVHPMHSTSAGALRQERWTSTFDSIQPFGRRVHRGAELEFYLSHFPYDGDNPRRAHADQPDRNPEWRLRDLGTTLVHGHTHDATQRAHLSALGTPMVHVGWDAWQRPVNQDELIKYIKLARKMTVPEEVQA